MICRKCKKEFDNNLPSCPHCGLPAGRANKPAQKKSNSQESFWIRMVAIAAAFFLVISTFAVVVTIEAGKNEDSSSVDKKDKDDKDENEKVKLDKNEGDGQVIIHDSDEDDEDDFIPTDNPKYGTYPQTKVTPVNDFANYSKLEDEAEKITSWKSFNESGLSNIRYYDVTVGEQKYRAVKQILPENSEVHWFKFEPIEWVEFETSSSYQHTIPENVYITKKILDFRPSDATGEFYSASNSLNSWLNSDSDGNFYRDVAFENETKKPCNVVTNGVMLINKADFDMLGSDKLAEVTDYAGFIANNNSENQIQNTNQWLIYDNAGKKLVTSDGKDYVANTPVGIRPVVEFKEELSNNQ